MKFFFGILAFIAAVVVVILLTVNLFKGLDNDRTQTTVSSTYDLTSKTAIDTVARFTTSGAVVADENYRQIRITVSKNARTVEVLKGYNNTVEKTSTVPNTASAYEAFLGALVAADFSKKDSDQNGSIASTCVTGNKFIYELQQASEKKIDSWTTSCSSRQGNFAGNVQGTELLFKNQIPNYSEFTSGVNLSIR